MGLLSNFCNNRSKTNIEEPTEPSKEGEGGGSDKSIVKITFSMKNSTVAFVRAVVKKGEESQFIVFVMEKVTDEKQSWMIVNDEVDDSQTMAINLGSIEFINFSVEGV